ncbi:major facilitator superfamily domain-containing protein [Myxozyma melibiosi]|uniref:Major facilitator superfamily domain-containing protein n=1 Tax=Myxozyma melibiosi TaxID=54550 RepID=A0ABR1EXQ5_9ASCO
MQSYLQMRRIRQSVTEICSDSEKNIASQLPSQHASSNSSTSSSPPPLETGAGILSCASRLEKESADDSADDVFIVGWDGPDDPSNPRNFSLTIKLGTTLIVAMIAFVVGAASATDSAVLKQSSEEFHVSEVVGSLSTGAYLIGYAFGAVLAAPFSETLGRNLIYGSTMFLFMCFIMGSALAPNIGGQIVLRFFSGFFGSTPLVCAGGSIADLWDQMDKTYAFPLYGVTGFGGPVMGPVIVSYIGPELNTWRWAEWMNLFMATLALIIILAFMPETFGPLILKWKAKDIRKVTGDSRYKAELEVTHKKFSTRMKVALTRPFVMATEPIIILMALYMTVIYIILFTFLDGFTYIFDNVYHIGQGLTNVCFLGLFIGMLLPSILIYPVYKITAKDLVKVQAEGRRDLDPEVRLWFGMMGGSVSIPVALLWMGWTDYASISIWSPLIASALFGYGVLCIFITVYMYVIDSYEIYAASALTLVTFMRYCVAGGMTVAGIPFYKNMGPHWTLTILACISSLLVPLPYVFYFWGKKIRAFSKHAAVKV